MGAVTFDICLYDAVDWRNFPEAVWQSPLGSYQLITHGLSYRELPLLGCSLSVDEARAVTREPELDECYTAVKAGAALAARIERCA